MHSIASSRGARASAWLALAAMAALVLSLFAVTRPALADPPGNNGTVKIDNMPFDDHPDNEPHVGCVFQVDFYGYDEGDLFADVTFEAQPPTGRGVLLTDNVFIGEDSNAGGGSEAGLDASQTYDLSAALANFTPHPEQGFHVKLTINADGSQGSDVKHKVFWVTGCGGEEQPLSLALTKVDQDDNPLAGVSFTLTSTADPSVTFTDETDDNGSLTFSGLGAGIYTLSEVPPEGCTGIDDVTLELAADGTVSFVGDHVGVTLDENGNLVIENSCGGGGEQPLSLGLGKVDQNGDGLAGVSFTLTSTSDPSVTFTEMTDSTGALTFTGLSADTFVLSEVAPEDCTGIADVTLTLAADATVTFVGDHAGVTVDESGNLVVENNCGEGGVLPGSLTLMKVDQDDNPLEGVSFTLTSTSDASVTFTAMTDENGSLTFGDLAADTYVLSEVAPEDCTGIADVTLTLAADGTVTFVGDHAGVTVDESGNLVVENTCGEGGVSPSTGTPAPSQAPPSAPSTGSAGPEQGVKGSTGVPNTALPDPSSGILLMVLAGLLAAGSAVGLAVVNVKDVRRRR